MHSMPSQYATDVGNANRLVQSLVKERARLRDLRRHREGHNDATRARDVDETDHAYVADAHQARDSHYCVRRVGIRSRSAGHIEIAQAGNPLELGPEHRKPKWHTLRATLATLATTVGAEHQRAVDV